MPLPGSVVTPGKPADVKTVSKNEAKSRILSSDCTLIPIVKCEEIIIEAKKPQLEIVNIDLCNSEDSQNTDIEVVSTKTDNLEIIKLPETLKTDVDTNNSEPNTPKKKKERSKAKDGDGSTSDTSPPKKAKLRGSSEELKHLDDDPKPRIVLTFRSEKPGLRSSTMKIVSPDEKTDEVSTRRSTRSRASEAGRSAGESDDNAISPTKKSIPLSQSQSETEESPEGTPALKRSTRRRSKEFSDNVIANAIARKEKSYNETPTLGPTQRLSRRIKPTAKVLANRELRIGLESQNNARLGISSDKSPEEGIQTRRSAKRKTPESKPAAEPAKPITPVKQRPKRKATMEACYSDSLYINNVDIDELSEDEFERMKLLGLVEPAKEISQEQEMRRINKLKKKHLSKLGLRAVEGKAVKKNSASNENLTDDSTMDSTKTDAIVEHLNKQKNQSESEKLNIKSEEPELIEAHELEDDEDAELLSIMDEEGEGSEEDSPDEDFECAFRPKASSSTRVTRKTAKQETRIETSSKTPEHSDVEQLEECGSPAGGDAGSVATDPGESARSVSGCLCTASSDIYMAPSTITEPVFCRAVECVNGARVGCSHTALRNADGEYAPLRRPGPRAPYFLACSQHTAQLAKHMCCPICGMFCSQGIFYRCSEGHLFHLECGIPYALGSEDAVTPGCPHCGSDANNADPVNKNTCKVKVEMKTSNRRIFLPNQRVQCTPAYLGFTKLSRAQMLQEPIIPEDLLPTPPINLQTLTEQAESSTDYEELLSLTPSQRLCEAITKGTVPENIITKLISGVDLNQSLELCEGGTYLHLAARLGNLMAVYLLHYAGGNLDATDSQMRTPLMTVLSAQLDTFKAKKNPLSESDVKMETDETEEVKSRSMEKRMKEDSQERESKGDKVYDEGKTPTEEEEEMSEAEKSLLKVIRYLIAAGCDVNFQGSEGLTALHMSARDGCAASTAALLKGARTQVDARDHGGWTPLVWAAENRHANVVRVLLRAGAAPGSCDSEGNGVLHWCALAGDCASLQLLLDAASPQTIDAVNTHGDTPLHVAARQDHYSCVVVLLARGARTDVENCNRELAVECAGAGECRSAISLNMQMTLAVRNKATTYKLLSSDISNGRETYPIPCVNEVDDTPLPSDFTYVTQHVQPRTLFLDNKLATIQGCECWGEACGVNTCECSVLGVRRWYSHGRLVPSFPYHDPPMLFECNQTCKCNLRHCPNAVVTRESQKGATLARVQVFRCGGALGWGLRALAPIQKGSPVAIYCGELLKASDADTRQRDQYMFALDLKADLLEQCEDSSLLCVDAASYGSAARFINHSCKPNLAPVRVFTSSRDLRLPAVTLFATRNIQPFDELTFDYGDKFWSVKSKWMQCLCSSADCRYPPISDDAEPT